MSIGTRIKQAREQAKLSRPELAKRLDISPSAISNYENDISSPRDTILYSIMRTLGVDANFIFQDVLPRHTKTPSDGTVDYLPDNYPAPPNEKKPVQDISLNELEFALFGEIRELDDEDKEELLRDARRMKELKELRNKQRDNK